MPKRRSTGKSSVARSRSQSAPGNSEAIIAQRIKEAQSALWRAELSRSLLMVVVATLVGITLWSIMDHWIWAPGKLVRTLALVGGIIAIVAWVTRRVVPLFTQTVLPEYAAHSLELDLPELRHSLTSYVSLRDDQNLDGVRGVVVRSIGVRAAGQLQHHEIEVPSEANTNMYWWLGVAAAIATAAGYALFSPKDAMQSTKRLLLPLATIEAPNRVQISDVMPGDTEVLAGRPFDVSAMITGLPSDREARVEYGTDFINSKLLDISSETRRHQVSIVVDGSTTYRIVGGDAIAGPFEIRTRNVPVVNIDHVQITPPAYTKLAPQQSRGGAIVGEENSIVKISGSLNLPIKRARIEFNPRQVGERIQATGGVAEMKILRDGMGVEANFPLRLPAAGSGAVAIQSYRLHVWDDAEIDNPEPIVYPIRIVADLAPEISITTPQAPLTEVPVNGAQRLEVQSLDPDYGLKQIDLKITRGVHKVATETIWSSVDGERGNQNATWVLQPDALGLRVGETIQVVAIGSDNRHDAGGTAAPNFVASDPIELKIVARQENSRQNLQDDANDKPQDDNKSAADESKQPSGGKEQQGQGGAGQGQQGQGGQGESAESQKGQEGQEGQAQSGESKEDESGKGQSENNASGGSGGKGSKEPSGDSEQGEMDSSSPQDGQQQPSDAPESSAGEPSAGKPSAGKPSAKAGSKPGTPQAEGNNKSVDQSPSGGDQNGEGQNAAGQNGDSKDASGGATQKPQHDGDAFERIRDFLKDNKDKEQSGEGNASEQDQQSEGQSAKGENGDSSSAADKPKTGEPSPGSGKSADGQQQAKPDTNSKGMGGSGEKKKDSSPKPDSESGENAASDNAAGEKSAKDEKSKAGQGSKKPDSGVRGATDGQSGQPQVGDQPSDEPKDATDGDGQADSGESANDGKTSQQSRDIKPSDDGSAAAEGANKSSNGNEGKNGDGRNGDGKPSPGESSSKKKPGEQTEQTVQQSNKPSDKNGSDSSRRPENQDGTSGTTGGGDTGDGIGVDPQELAQAPDPVNVEEAKKATELVLNYLDQQRETPDPELLKQLDWTSEELKAFADRWNRIRDLEKMGTADKSTVDDALQSLGIRENQTGPIGKTSDTDDSLRGLKDGGNRVPAPSIYQDAFESFRRNVNRDRRTPK